MSKSAKNKKTTAAESAGEIAFWVTFLLSLALPIPGFWKFVGVCGVSVGTKKLFSFFGKSKKERKESKPELMGNIAFWVSFLLVCALPIGNLAKLIGGFGIAKALKKLVKTMATPLEGLHTENGERVKEEPATDVKTPEDQRARDVVVSGLELLSQIAQERNAIDEYVMTRRLKDLDEIVRKMLQTVVDDPSDAPRMRKFMSYYLPTTLKLLQSYRTMKERGVSYSEITATRENLVHALDKIIQAAQKQLDALYENDLLDMSTDMDVLEQMLRRDGYMESAFAEAAREAITQSAPAQTYSTQQADLHTPTSTAAARQLQQGAPILQMPPEDLPPLDVPQQSAHK